jgi:hypothetical protein
MTGQFAYELMLRRKDSGKEVGQDLEEVIFEDPFYGFRYAQQYIGRSKKVEQTILNYADKKNSDIALWYAQEVIKGIWTEAESIIAKNKYNAFKYVRDCTDASNIDMVTDCIHKSAFSGSPAARKDYVQFLKERNVDFNKIIDFI